MFVMRWIIKTVATYWDAISAVLGWAWTIAGGVLTGWAAWSSGILSQYAPLSWVGAGLLGALVSAAGLWLAAKSYYLLVHARWARTLSHPGDGVNPLDDSFSRKRIKINDFVSPAHQLIENKNFDRCELIGPTLILLQNASLINSQMYDCNFICCKDNVAVFNVTVVKDCSILNCKLYRLTFLIPESSVNLLPPGIFFISRIPTEFNLPVPWSGPIAPPAQQIQQAPAQT